MYSKQLVKYFLILVIVPVPEDIKVKQGHTSFLVSLFSPAEETLRNPNDWLENMNKCSFEDYFIFRC